VVSDAENPGWVDRLNSLGEGVDGPAHLVSLVDDLR